MALSYLDQYVPLDARVLWLEPRAALVDQVWKSAGQWMKNRGRLRVTTVQAILASNAPPPEADLCVVDEAHFFFGSPEWSAIAHCYPIRLALTATPSRADGRALGELCDSLVIGPSRATLTRLGVLPPVITYGPENKRKTEAWGPVMAYQRWTPGERAIVFCGSIEHAKNVAARFNEAGIKAGVATSEDSEDLEMHRAGHLDVICNVYMISVGYDDPTITVAILARPMGNASTYLQAIGRARGLGSKRVAVIDPYGTAHEWGLPEDDRAYSLLGSPIRVKTKIALAVCGVCQTMYRPSPFTVQCSLCQAPRPKFVTPAEKKRAAMEERRTSENIEARRTWFINMVWVTRGMAQKAGADPFTFRTWLPGSAYKKRYGVRPPIEWIVEFGLE